MVSRKRKRAAGYTTPETKKKKESNHIFVRTLPIIGEVPMLFFLPKCTDAKRLRNTIEDYGGKVVDTYEAYVYQIKTSSIRKKTMNTFHRGYVYNQKWIMDSVKEGKLIEDVDEYMEGFHKKSKLATIPKGKRKQYTISEVLRLWEFVEKEGRRKKSTKGKDGTKKKYCPPLSFFQKIEAENTIPDRSATSLRTAWKKFSQMTRHKFVKGALKKNSRFSHNFQEVPEVIASKKVKGAKRQLFSVFNSASTRPQEEIEEDSNQSEEMGVDMDVMTKEPSIIDKGSEDMEFILAIEDMQSAISNQAAQDGSYSMNPRKRKRTPLGDLYENEDTRDSKEENYKRVKVTEHENKGNLFAECDTTVYDQEDLHNFIEADAKIVIHSNSESIVKVESNLPKKANAEEEEFFKVISQQLEELCETYGKTMEEMQTYWMEACCDLDDLEKILKNEKQRWTQIEDLAVQSDPGSQEFGVVRSEKGQDEIAKRRKFLELE